MSETVLEEAAAPKPGATSPGPTKDASNALAISAVFGIAFAVAYIWSLYANQGPLLLIYYPVINQWSMSVIENAGPAMRWYGFVINALLIACIAAGVAALLKSVLRSLSTAIVRMALLATGAALIIQGIHAYEHFFVGH